MKASFEKIIINNNELIRVYDFKNSHFDAPWHYHPEYELTLILKSEGKRYIGSSINKFSKDDLALLGPNLPHIWKNNQDHFKYGRKSHAIVIHFSEEFTTSNFFEYDESKKVRALLDDAQYGLVFDEKSLRKIIPLIKGLVVLKGFERVLSFLKILHKLSVCSKTTKLNGSDFLPKLDVNSSKRINKVCNYIYKNFDRELKLNFLADLAGMNPNAFSRYFKNRIGVPLSKFIIQVRINNACYLLIESDLSISEICYECGFNSISNFNKIFKSIKQVSPSSFRVVQNQKL